MEFSGIVWPINWSQLRIIVLANAKRKPMLHCYFRNFLGNVLCSTSPREWQYNLLYTMSAFWAVAGKMASVKIETFHSIYGKQLFSSIEFYLLYLYK